ncbi:hypothetical protein CupriaWKF_33955 [Cupriavidus sp. WKF15]|uniref:hypothetical protein n=1 Tax=Cupriavidus sp. WKF15 TaxID=3032282 RepID=UPI0023E14130|nr:hypothetical protein [Cupriavidus sp. WKF15]WER50529.1 hypothetical protein CupriaWKF_33955 [Cupriavidus sp. WKF15]
MADATQLMFVGDWRITVTGRDASWGERISVQGTLAGTQTLAGNPGAVLDVFGNGQTPWTLTVEHNDGQHGWQPSWVRGASSIAGAHYSWVIESEDNTTPSSDRDFNDLVVSLDKLGMAAQPVSPFAIMPGTLQAIPEGVFEATLGRYLMAVQVQNIWTLPWPPSARVGLTDRCRTWLAAAGVVVIDLWSTKDQEALEQSVVGGRVAAGGLGLWQSRRIYFKVDVSQAIVRKHWVELQVLTDQGAEDIALINKAARAPMSVSRTTFDSARSAFVSRCDEGQLTASIKRMVIDLNTFKRAVDLARRLGLGGTSDQGVGTPGGGATGGGAGSFVGCDRRTLELVRERLRAFLDGKDVDLCALWRLMACCCPGGTGGDGGGRDGGGDWTGGNDQGLGFFVWPADIDYAVDYLQPFTGQFGPIPFQDPWWKVLLIIIAIILSIAAAVSGGADLVNRSDDRVIGTLTRSVLNALKSQPATSPLASDPGSVDAAVVTLNGNRGLTPAIFSALDAASGEAAAMPIVALGGHIDTPGTFLSNAQIAAVFQNLADHPGDPAAQDAVRAFKSGARSGTSTGLLMSGVVPVQPRGPEDDGSTIYFLNQLRFDPDETGAALSCPGDSGSLWFQKGSHAVIGLNHAGSDGADAIACRIEDVLTAMSIRFA